MRIDYIENFVKKYRLEKGVTQQQLADCIGVSRQTIVAIEGKKYTPSVLLTLRIAQELGQSVETLFTLKKNL